MATRKSNKRFFQFCAYAFLTPICIMCVVFLINKLEIIPDKFNIGIGNISCAVPFDQTGQFFHLEVFYSFGPLVLFLIINTTFYGITSYKILSVQRETTSCMKDSNGRHAKLELQRTRSVTYVNLIVQKHLIQYGIFFFVQFSINQ